MYLRVIIQLCSLDLEFICTSVFFNWLTHELTRKSCDYLCKQQFLFHLFAVTSQLNYEVKMPDATLSGRVLAPGIQLFLFPNLDMFLIIQFLTNLATVESWSSWINSDKASQKRTRNYFMDNFFATRFTKSARICDYAKETTDVVLS